MDSKNKVRGAVGEYIGATPESGKGTWRLPQYLPRLAAIPPYPKHQGWIEDSLFFLTFSLVILLITENDLSRDAAM